eukprot:SM000044S16011  [mRNA]  locus=s44:538830:543829:- [translate_table: standard]
MDAYKEQLVNHSRVAHAWLNETVKDIPWLRRAVNEASFPPTGQYARTYLVPVAVAIFAVFVSFTLGSLLLGKRVVKKRGVVIKTPGPNAGYSMRSARFLIPVETPSEGVNTVPALWEKACTMHKNRRCLGTREVLKVEVEKDPKSGKEFEKWSQGDYTWLTFSEAFSRTEHLASGLVALGHSSGEKVAMFAETRAEWLLSLEAAFRQSWVVVTVYASLGEEALVHSLNETEVTTVICDSKQYDKILEVAGQLKAVKRVIVMADHTGLKGTPPECEYWKVASFHSVEELGASNPVDANLPKPDDIAVIMYTSGSTGLPKGVMMSHQNLVSTIAGVLAVVPDLGPSDVYLAYLPLAHVLELAAETGLSSVGMAIGYGSPMTLIDSSNKVKKGTRGDAPALAPTLMAAVPAILDRIRDGVRKQVEHKGGTVKTLFELAYKRRLAALEGSWLGAWGLEAALWQQLVFRKIQAAIGGRVRGMLSGGAPLSGDTQRFMNICFGMPIGQGYGLTETCAGGTFSEWDDRSVGRVGPPIPCSYIKLINWEEGNYRITDKPYPRGEICIGGPNVTPGYFKNEKKTNEDFHVDEEGMRWFHTGDVGQFHDDGCLEIVDRKKDIVKLQHGEYISLGKVESVLSSSPYVDNVMLHAESSQSNAVALIVAAQQPLEKWATSANVQYSSFSDLCEKKEAKEEVLKSLSKVGREGKLEKVELPTKVKLLPEAWTPESGLVTAALKLKRDPLRKAFADDLKQLYS